MPDIQQYSVSIKFETKGSEKAANDTKKINDSLGKLKGSTTGFSAITKGLSQIGGKISKAGVMFKGMAVAGAIAFTKLGKGAFNMSKQMGDYIETLNLFRASMGDAADEATEFINKAENLLGMDPRSMMDSISSFQNLSEGFGIASDRAYIMSKNLTQLSGDLSSFANISFDAAQKKLMSGFSGQVMPLRKYGIALDQASLQELAYSLGIEQRVKTMTRAQKTELIYYQIMKSTQKMQGDLGRTLMSPANALRVLQTEFLKLGRAVGSIFIPMMQRIIPVIRAVTKALTSAAQAIAKFFGFDIGDYTANLDTVGNLLEGVGEGVDDVGGAAEGTAKKLNKMLMPFDELNNITSSNDSGSGGGAGGGDISGGSLGIDLPEYDMFASIEESFNDMILNGDWKEMGRSIGKKINEMLSSIPWSEIKSQFGKVGKNIAEFLNGGIEETDWKLVGKTFAESLNTIIEFAYNFVTTFNWKEFGKSLSDTVNGFFENVEWDKAGQTFDEGIKGVLDGSIAFISNLDTTGITDAIEQFLSNIDWIGIAERLIVFLNKLAIKVVEAPVNLIIDSINSLNENIPKPLQGSLSILSGGKIDRVDLSKDISSYGALTGAAMLDLKDVEYQTRKTMEATEEYGEKTKQSAIDVEKSWSDVQKNVDTATSNTQKDIISMSDLAEAMGRTTFGQYVLGIKSQEPVIQSTVKGIMSDIKDKLDISDMSGSWGRLLTGNYAKGVQNEQSTLNAALEKVASDIKGKLNISNVTETWGKLLTGNYVKGIGSEQTNLRTVVQKITTDIKNKLNISNATETWGRNLVSQYSKGIENQKKVLNNAVNVIKDAVKSSLDRGDLSKGWGMNLIDKFKDGINKQNQSKALLSSFQSVINNARNYLDAGRTAYTWGEDMMKGFINGINALKNKIAKTAESVANSISSFLHFSKPDVGPLRDYETWMPDMIKGLSDTLIKASPILDNTVAGITTRIADSFNNLSMPEVNETVSLNQPSNQLIGNIANKLNRTNTDENTNNMIRATYEAVSRALLDNNGTNDRQPIIVNVGNREVYRGYGQYKDEQSNMLGVTV